MLIKYFKKILLLIVLGLLVCSCTSRLGLRNPAYAPVAPEVTIIDDPVQGSIYQEGMRVGLFDSRAKYVGDLLTIKLVENANASKSAKTSANKNSQIDEKSPTVAGGDVTVNNRKILENNVDSNRKFKSQGDSAQSHSLTAELTVMVARVLPNKHLLIRGEKLIMLNQGNEYIRLMGIVRPEDITSNNTVKSSRVANVQISYGGQGVINDANKMGWLNRFFQGPSWPY